MIPQNETIAQRAKRLLSPIPAEEFTTERGFTDEMSKCCAIGHLNRLENNPIDYSIRNCSLYGDDSLSAEIEKLSSELGFHIWSVNDKLIGPYQEKTAKDRVMHLLEDMIAAGY